MTTPMSALSQGIKTTSLGIVFLGLGVIALLWYMLPWTLLVPFVNSGAATIWTDVGYPRAFGIGILGVFVYYSLTLAVLFFAWRFVSTIRDR